MILIALTFGRSAAGQEAAIRFENATEASSFTSLPDFGGHGIPVADADGDGWLDIYVQHLQRSGGSADRCS
jgi:hypothetical protein